MVTAPHNVFCDCMKAANLQEDGRESHSFLLVWKTSDLGPKSLLLLFLLRDAVKANMSKIREQKRMRADKDRHATSTHNHRTQVPVGLLGRVPC